MHSCLLLWVICSEKLDIKINTVVSYNHQSLQAEHWIKSLSNILTKHLTYLGQMWQKYLPLATFTYNTFNTPNLGNFSPYKLVFGWKPKLFLNLETMPDINVLDTIKNYYELLNKGLQYLHKLLQDFKSKKASYDNIDRIFFQNNSRDLVYIISPLTVDCTPLQENLW